MKLFALALALALIVFGIVAVAVSWSSTGDGWRWPRYDRGPVKLHIVTDAQFPPALLPALKAASKEWERTGDLRFDYPKGLADCDVQTRNTICVSGADYWDAPWNGMGGWSWQAALSGGEPSGEETADARAVLPTASPPLSVKLLGYARLWINTIYHDDTTPLPHWSQHTFCHELGHNIGLGHTEDGPWTGELSCMANDFGYYSYKPGVDDLAFIHALYNTRDAR